MVRLTDEERVMLSFPWGGGYAAIAGLICILSPWSSGKKKAGSSSEVAGAGTSTFGEKKNAATPHRQEGV
jgi:hypothetical protein